ncbi:MAG: hypothetical protein ACK5VS_11160 [Hyphomonadaceae bacterium]
MPTLQPATTNCQSARSIDLGIDTNLVRNCGKTGLRHHEIIIGVVTNDQSDWYKIAAVLCWDEEPGGPPLRAFIKLGKHDDAKITSFIDGAAALRSYLKCSDIKAAPMRV